MTFTPSELALLATGDSAEDGQGFLGRLPDARIRELLRHGHTTASLAKKCGIGRDAVVAWRKANA